MPTLFRYGALTLLVMALAAGLAVVGLYVLAGMRLDERVAAPAESVSVPSDFSALQRGQHLASAVARCVQCHGPNLAGSVLSDSARVGRIVAPNLTRGSGGIGAARSDADLGRAIRHGLDPQGRPLLSMPSDDYSGMGDADLGAIVAYIRSVPPVESRLPPSDIRPVGRILFALGRLPLLPSSNIDQFATRPPAPQPGVTPAYGAYLSRIAGCASCHGPGFSTSFAEADFLRVMRTGTLPDGSIVATAMPWQYFAQMTDDELRAIWTFLTASTQGRSPTG
jgi:mono/diheme cytochrome c family protein